MKIRTILAISSLLFAFGLSCSSDDSLTSPGGACADNHQPVLVSHPDTSATVGATIWLKPQAHDTDGDSLRYDCFVNSSWSDFRRGTIPIYEYHEDLQMLEFRPSSYDRPDRRIYFIVHDECAGSDTTTFTVFIN
jgi:hypothetical protein